MNKHVIGVVVAALLVFGASLGGALAFIGDDGAQPAQSPLGSPTTAPTPVHRMSDGSLMEGPGYEMPMQTDEQRPSTDRAPGDDDGGMMDNGGMMDEGGMHGGGMMDGGMGHGG